MKKLLLVFLLAGMSIFINEARAQDFYTVTAGEILFQWSDIQIDNMDVKSNLRFTGWFHVGEFVHLDFGNTFGIFSGLGVRNVGFITEEDGVKTKYRSYTLGIPLAIKLGSFKKGAYLFGGGEYEFMFHYKNKTFVGDTKSKYSEWFSNRTPSFIPSAIAGIQFPGGGHISFKYYLDNFLNHSFYKEHSDGTVEDFSEFNQTQVFYISLGLWIPNSRVKKKYSSNDKDAPTDM